jgi:hypothetical protein
LGSRGGEEGIADQECKKLMSSPFEEHLEQTQTCPLPAIIIFQERFQVKRLRAVPMVMNQAVSKATHVQRHRVNARSKS